MTLVSPTENIDWANPSSILMAQVMGAFAEHYSRSLSTHVQKGVGERALQGLHLGAIPFGYQSCWTDVNGEKHLRCLVEHPDGVHAHPKEGPALQKVFRQHAAFPEGTA